MTGPDIPVTGSRIPRATVLRITAVGCLVMSLPIAFLKYPWLPATILEYNELRQAPSSGTPSYQQDHEHQIELTQKALSLYATGSLALCGLAAIVLGILPYWAEIGAWLIAAAAGLEIGRFGQAYVDRSTDLVYVIVTVKLPFIIALVAAAAALVRLALQLSRLRSDPA